MGWYLKNKIASHCIDRIDQRLSPYRDVMINRMNWAKALYKHKQKNVAVVVYEFPISMKDSRTGFDDSNGNWVIAVFRNYPNNIGDKFQCSTIMLRRSPDHPFFPQACSAQALFVDELITYKQFTNDINFVQTRIREQRQQTQQPTEPKPAVQEQPIAVNSDQLLETSAA